MDYLQLCNIAFTMEFKGNLKPLAVGVITLPAGSLGSLRQISLTALTVPSTMRLWTVSKHLITPTARGLSFIYGKSLQQMSSLSPRPLITQGWSPSDCCVPLALALDTWCSARKCALATWKGGARASPTAVLCVWKGVSTLSFISLFFLTIKLWLIFECYLFLETTNNRFHKDHISGGHYQIFDVDVFRHVILKVDQEGAGILWNEVKPLERTCLTTTLSVNVLFYLLQISLKLLRITSLRCVGKH